MSVELGELREAARQVVDAAGLPAAEDGTWSQLVELGWLLVAMPEQLGGLDTGIEGACTLHEALGRGLCAAPFLPAMMAIDALCASAPADRDAWLERITGGERVSASLATGELYLEDDTLRGEVPAVQCADTASHALLWTTGGPACVALVALDQAGVERIERPTWDRTRRLFDLRLDGVPLARQTLLARDGKAEALTRRLLTLRDFALAADAIGGANALLEMTVEHLKVRVQFKRPLAMFQALKHRCADLKAGTAAAEALLFNALAVADLAGAEAEHQAKSARLLATSTFLRVAEESLQLHGGIGMAEEHPCHLFLKRALLTEHLGRDSGSYARDIAEHALLKAQAE